MLAGIDIPKEGGKGRGMLNLTDLVTRILQRKIFTMLLVGKLTWQSPPTTTLKITKVS